MRKTIKGCHAVLLKCGGFVPPIMSGADYSVSTHPPSPGLLRRGSGIVTRQAGWLPWALGTLEKRGQWLYLFAIEKDYRS